MAASLSSATPAMDAVTNEPKPTVVFTLGQKWHSSASRLQDMYVRVEVKPMKAVEMLLTLSAAEHERGGGGDGGSVTSINRSLLIIEKSLEPVSGSSCQLEEESAMHWEQQA